jgi:hypothetical protein
MSAFRKTALAFAAAALMATSAMAQLPGVGPVPPQGFAAGVTAPNVPTQPLVCNTTAQPLTVRTEGFAELMGDLILNCTGSLQINPRNFRPDIDAPPANVGGPNPTNSVGFQFVNISVTLSTPVTNRLVGGTNMTDALLFLSDGNGQDPTNPAGGASPNNQNPCPTANGNGVCSPLFQHDGGNNNITANTIAGGAAFATSVLTGAPTSVSVVTNPSGNPVNVYQGQLQNNNTVVFLGVPVSQLDSTNNPNLAAALAALPAPYDGRPISVSFTKRFRVKNLRGAIPGAAAANGQVFGFLSIQNPPANLQLNSASAVVGFVQNGLLFDRRTPGDGGFDANGADVNYPQCADVNRNAAVDATASSLGGTNRFGFAGRFREQFANAFKIRGFVPGQLPASDQNNPQQLYNTESGFYNQNFTTTNGLNRAGIADHGTRLRMFFNNVQANTRIYASIVNFPASGFPNTLGAYGVVTDITGANQSPLTVPVFASSSFGLTAGAVPAPAGVFAGASAAWGYVQVAIGTGTTGGSGAQTWEVYAADPSNPEAAIFQVFMAFRSANNPGLGVSTVSGSFAPLNSTATASSSLAVPIPRFQDTGTAATAFTIATCVTNLLFPFVSNLSGFDTGVAISNTSLSNPGTGELFPATAPATQQGACSINYFGFTGAGRGQPPAPATSAAIPAGQTLTFTLSSGGGAPFGNIPATPGFQGYIIAQCNFRYAHGYAFISDVGAAQLAHGYIALVMDAAVGSRTGAISESLGL